MKYINKKLPLMEVGKEIDYSLNGVIIGAHCYDDGTLHCTQADFNLLLKDGFIEEVKPREFYIGLTSQGYLPLGDNKVADNIDYFDTMAFPPAKVIKVREVIE